jgi:hypothetical protein
VIALGLVLGLPPCAGGEISAEARPQPPAHTPDAAPVPRDAGARDAGARDAGTRRDAGMQGGAMSDDLPTESLDALLARARNRNGAFVPATAGELKRIALAANKLLAALDARTSITTLRATFAAEGFELVHTRLGSSPAVAIIEAMGHQTGRGFYVLREEAGERDFIVQVPHSFYDEHTLPIGLAVASLAGRALFVNTVYRYASGAPPAGGKVDESASAGEPAASDLAHQTETVWQAISASALARFPTTTLLQLHGFADRVDPLYANTAVVVSPSIVTRSTADATALAGRLGMLLMPLEVRLYPRDIDMLGATLNKQAELVAAHPAAGFLHVEMSRSLRKRLAGEATLLERFAAAVVERSE